MNMLQYKLLKFWQFAPSERKTKMTVNILAVGDVCGKTGMEFLAHRLPAVKKM